MLETGASASTGVMGQRGAVADVGCAAMFYHVLYLTFSSGTHECVARWEPAGSPGYG